MGKSIKVREFLGDNYSCEDAIVLKESLKNSMEDGVVLDFEGYDRVSSTFLTCLFTDLIEKSGREYISTHIDVKNLSNYSDYSRVVLGTTFKDNN